MQPDKMLETARYRIARSADEGLRANWAESKPTYCERWVRQVLTNAGVPDALRTDGSPDAATSLRMYEEKGCVMPVGTAPQIGDLLYWTGNGHGSHGHVGIKTRPAWFAENSSVHTSGPNGDARGSRLIANCPGYRVVRLWENS